MKYFPYKILLLCLILPPVVHILSIQGLETYLQEHEITKVRGVLIDDVDALLEGRYSVKEEVNRNLGAYLNQQWLTKMGVDISVMVKTKDGHILYPPPVAIGGERQSNRKSLNYVELAAKNYQMLQDGLDVILSVRVRYGGFLSISLLGVYILVSLFVLQHFVRKGMRAVQDEEMLRQRQIQELSESLKQASARLAKVREKEQEYAVKIEALKKEKTELSHDVDSLLEEMENLEKGLEQEKQLKEKIEMEMSRVQEELESVRGQQKGGKRKDKKFEAMRKRFRVLYKNVSFTDRAIEGFMALPEGFQLKAEELISRLNHDGLDVQVKRKVFGKGGKKDILESYFSYSGRLYFQRDQNGRVRVLAIGTKNTQAKDLAYLETLG